MSHRTKEDYAEVLNSIWSALDEPQLEKTIMDFESGIWTAQTNIMGPGVKQQGCNFHFSKAIWTHTVDLQNQQSCSSVHPQTHGISFSPC